MLEHSIFLLLDIAPVSRIGFFLIPVLIAAVIIVAVAVLVTTIRNRYQQMKMEEAKRAAPEMRERDAVPAPAQTTEETHEE